MWFTEDVEVIVKRARWRLQQTEVIILMYASISVCDHFINSCDRVYMNAFAL